MAAEACKNAPVTPCALDHESFVFISYAHDDKEFLLPILSGIHAQGYAVWYDQGINISSTWTDEIARGILNCRVFIAFISNASMGSQYVRNEIEFALNNQKTIVPVYLDKIDILPDGLAMGLTSTQGVINIWDPEAIVEKIGMALEYNKVEKSGPAGTAEIAYLKRRAPAERKRARLIMYALAAALVFGGLAGLGLKLAGRDHGREFIGAWGGTVHEHLSYPGAPPQYLYEITHNEGNNYYVTITYCIPGRSPKPEGSPNMPISYNPETRNMNISVGWYSSNGVIDRKTGEMVLRAMRMTRVDPEEVRRQWAEEERKAKASRD